MYGFNLILVLVINSSSERLFFYAVPNISNKKFIPIIIAACLFLFEVHGDTKGKLKPEFKKGRK